MNSIAAHHAEIDAFEANADWFDANMPDWADRERYGVDLLGEGDFALSDDTLDVVPDEDWDAFFEMTYVDPAERLLA